MKRTYSMPRTAIVNVELENVMFSMSQMVTGGNYDAPPLMGTDGEGIYGRCLNDYTDL